MKARPIDIRDSLVEGAAEEQRKRGMIPQITEAQTEFARMLAEFERQPKVKVNRTESGGDAALAREAERRAAGAGQSADYSSARRAHGPVVPRSGYRGTPVAREYERRLRARLRLLRSKPEWSAKLRAINPLALQGSLGEAKQREADAAVKRVITASNAVFGDWRKVKARPLRFDLGART